MVYLPGIIEIFELVRLAGGIGSYLLLENQKEADSGDEPTLTVGMGSKQKTDSFVTAKESCI